MNISLESGILYGTPNIRMLLPKIGKTTDYVPLFTIYRPFPANLGNLHRLPDSPVKTRLTALREAGELAPLQKLMIAKASDAIVDGVEYYREFLHEYRESLNELINDQDLDFQIQVSNSGGSSYVDLFNGVNKKNYWELHRLRSGNYISNLGYTAFSPSSNRNNKKYTTLFCFVAKREMIPYLRMCYLMGEEPHPDALELWVREDLDVVRSQYTVRSNYRKYVKKVAEDSGIQIVNWPDLDKLLFYNSEIPKFKKISEKKEWVQQASREFLEARQFEKRLLEDYSIKLVA